MTNGFDLDFLLFIENDVFNKNLTVYELSKIKNSYFEIQIPYLFNEANIARQCEHSDLNTESYTNTDFNQYLSNVSQIT